jgi:peptidoglycan/xylan/chitin deacetylase (PgdA/CDA1 family)
MFMARRSRLDVPGPFAVAALSLLVSCGGTPGRPSRDGGRAAGADARGDARRFADGDLAEVADAAEDAGEDAPDDDTAGNGITSNGCAGGACLNPSCQPLGEPAAPGRFPELGFEARPAYIPADVVVPTLDDAPDRPYTSADGVLYTRFGAGDWTRQVLEWLEAQGLHFDFFVNTANLCDVARTPGCADVFSRILRSQNPGNHTVHHVHLGSECHALEVGASLACEDEITGVESLVQALSNGGIPHLTRFRAPYGEPFQTSGAALAEIQGVVAHFAVHVGWAIDAGDAAPADDGRAPEARFFADNVTRALGPGPGQGSWGIVRLQATAPWSRETLQLLFDPHGGTVRARGFRVGTVEDVICWKYGRHSWELISQITGHHVGEN